MEQGFDLLIRGGSVVDGTGAAARRADVGLRDGRIAAVGPDLRDGRQVLDASGLVVAPGFVDIHTHYDVQIFWDRWLSCSPEHGVTTVVMGNCGFGVAPTHKEHRDLLLRTLENVEGMSLDALRAGLGSDWPFETFPEYIAAIEKRNPAINVAALVGHTPLRTYVMGEEAVSREATPEEIAKMRALVREALDAGALGFATSKSPTHVGYDGKPVPSRAASMDEIRELAGVLAEVPHGIMQSTLGPGLSFEEFGEIARRIKKPVSWAPLLSGFFGPNGHRPILERHAKMQAEGLRVVPQVTCRPLVLEFQFRAPFPLEMLPEMKAVSAGNMEERMRIYADPEFRAALRTRIDTSDKLQSVRTMVLSHFPPDPSLCERPVDELAAERGVHPVDLALDLSLQTNLLARFRLAAFNTNDDEVGELVSHPASMIGLSDAGAHASQLCDTGASTTLLGKWVREKKVLSLEEGVRRLTGQPAEIFGIKDRGRLEVGLAADVTVFDPDTIACGALRRIHDLPGGADRLVAASTGIRFVVVNGVLIQDDGERKLPQDGPLPGRILRGGTAS